MSDPLGEFAEEAQLDPSGEIEQAEDVVRDSSIHTDELVGMTGGSGTDPDSLVEGNRVATAEDME